MSRFASPKTAQIWADRIAQCERSNAPVAQRTQGGASLCPGLSHFAPLGRRHHNLIVWGLSPVFRQSGEFQSHGCCTCPLVENAAMGDGTLVGTNRN